MIAKCPRCRKDVECDEYVVGKHKVFICDPCAKNIVLEWAIKKLDIDVLKES